MTFRRLVPCVLVSAMALLFAGSVPAVPSPDVVISQVYGGGGNSGATLRNDFIELFNRGTTPVDVSGWSVQYGSSTGTTWQVTALSGTIAPGQYYLVREAAGSGGTVDLPVPDASGSIAMSATAGKVALATSSAALSGGCPLASTRDFVGYGGANCAETTPAPGLSNTTAALRNPPAPAPRGCQDTDSNSADFTTGPPEPRNSASPRNPCVGDQAPAVAAVTPPAGSTENPTSSNITVTFSEEVVAVPSAFRLTCTLSGNVALTVTPSGASTTYVLDPQVDLQRNETCTATVTASGVTDVDTLDPPDMMAADYSFSFSTTGLALRIHDIQDHAHISPYNGSLVSQVPGVITAATANGFYMQDSEPDSDVRTSEGIFVFTGSSTSLLVGTAVRVSGRVLEFRPGCVPSCSSTSGAFANLTTTEIVTPTAVAAGPGPVIPATVVGLGGRIPPTTVIANDSPSGDVETSNTFDPQEDGIDFYESLEGMLVQINKAVVVGPRSDFGEIPVLSDNGSYAGIRTARGGIVVRKLGSSPPPRDYEQGDFNPERLILDDAIRPTPPVDVRDGFTTSVRAVVDYSFANFKFLVLNELTPVDGGLAREITGEPDKKELTVATFNVENLDPADGAAKFGELAELIVRNLRSPAIVALEEIQDNNGPVNDATTDATLTYRTLIAAIQSAGGPTYDFRQVDPVDDQDGGQPGGNIRVGFIFRTDLPDLTFVDRPGGTPTTQNGVVAAGQGARLLYSPGRIDPTNPAFANSRKPLAAEFLYRNRRVILIANHFNSKGGDQPLFGRFQPPARSSEVQRHQQARIVNDFVDSILAVDPKANIVVLGDLNDFEFSTTLDLLEGGVLSTLIETLPQPERYTYVFEGNSQALDHILVSNELAKHRPVYDIVHVNAEFADQASDHDPQVARLDVQGRAVPAHER